MIQRFSQLRADGITTVTGLMAIAARTAPKARGMDNLEIIVIGTEENEQLRRGMLEYSRKHNRPSFERDARSIEQVDTIVIIGTRTGPIGLDCGACGFGTCEGLTRAGGVCAYNAMDLGIALGSAAGIAGDCRVDTRLMYSIGKVAIALGFFEHPVGMAIGIPVSVTGKNPFFDRT